MIRAMTIVLGAIVGFMEGVVLFGMINFSLDAPFAVITAGEWMEYPSLMFGLVGAILGAGIALAVCPWTKTPLVYVSAPNKPSKPGDPPRQGPLG